MKWLHKAFHLSQYMLICCDSNIKLGLFLTPGLDMESRNNKKRCMGRVTKNLADLTLQAGLVADSLSLYNSSTEMLKSDWLWLAAAKEGKICFFFNLTITLLQNQLQYK